MAEATLHGRVRPRALGSAAARVPSRALRVPRHPPESRPPSLVGRDADGGSILREDRARAAGPTAAPADAFIGGRRTGIPGRVAAGHDWCAAIADEEPGLCTPAPVSGRPRGRSRVYRPIMIVQLIGGVRGPPGPKAQSTNSCALGIFVVQPASLVSAESKALARVFLHAASSLWGTGR